MLDTIKQFLKEHEIDEKAGFIIAVSGGADSITLLHAFKYLNLRIHALHCNFNLRGKESNMDEQFVKRFCETYGIPMSVKHFDTQEYAKKKEHQHRDGRTGIALRLVRRNAPKKKWITLSWGTMPMILPKPSFINICRGTGIKGLTGIRPVKEPYPATAPVLFPGRDHRLH